MKTTTKHHFSPFRLELVSPQGNNLAIFSLTAGQVGRMLLDLKCKLDYDKDIALELGDQEEAEEYRRSMNKCWETIEGLYKCIEIQETPKHQKSIDNGGFYEEKDEEE